MDAREANLGIASGEKGCGKTYSTLAIQVRNALSGGGGKYRKRKVLFLDTNNEYGNVQKDHKNPNFPKIKALDVDNLSEWLHHPTIDARRISVMKPDSKGGGKRNTKELQELLSKILAIFRNGLLIVEDMTNFVSDSLPSDLVGSIVTQRHLSVDVIIHFQSIGKTAHPKLWSNCNWFRFHKCGDDIAKNKNKLTGDLTALYIAEKMIHKKDREGDKRFFVYYNKSTTSKLIGKITGGFTRKMFREATEEYLQDNMSLVNKEIKRVDLYTGQLVHPTRKKAIDYLIDDAERKYYGNPLPHRKRKIKKSS
jgi:hypothetical protein